MNYKSKLITIRTEANQATIDIDGTIGEGWFEEGNTIETVRRDIEAVSALKADKITVNVSSLGGDYYHGVGIHNVLKQSSAQIEVNIMGYTASAGTLISIAGDTVKMADNVMFLVHQAWTGMLGNATELRALAEELDAIDLNQARMYATATGRSEEEILELMAADNGNGKWLTAEEAKEWGFVDEVYTATKVAASVDKVAAKALKIELPKIDNKKFHMEILNTINEKLDKVMASFSRADKEQDESQPVETVVSAEELETINGRIDSLSEVIEGYKAQVVELEAEKVDFEAKVSELESKVSEYEAKLANGIDTSGEGGKEKPSANVSAADNLAKLLK